MSLIRNGIDQVFVSLTRRNSYYYSDRLRGIYVEKGIKRNANKFLFILSPPYCGSTLLNEILSTSENVSCNNREGTREGQQLPSVKDIMFNHDRKWDESFDYDWEMIKREWMQYWDLSAPVLLEKSPPNIIRARSINKYFTPAFFIVFYRNPYAQAESLIRRKSWMPDKAAQFAIRCLKYQKSNIQSFHRAVSLSYEELTENPLQAKELLVKFLPELADISIDLEFDAHNFKNKSMGITNLNDEKVKCLTKIEFDAINSVFKRNVDTLSFFNYQLVEL